MVHRRDEWGVTAVEYDVSFYNDVNVLEFDSGDGLFNSEYTKTH